MVRGLAIGLGEGEKEGRKERNQAVVLLQRSSSGN